MMSDKENLKERYIGKYTDILLHILTLEDPKYAGVNHYMLLQRSIRQDGQQNGLDITDEDIAAKIKNAASEVARKFLEEGKSFHHLYSSEVFGLIEPVVLHRVP